LISPVRLGRPEQQSDFTYVKPVNTGDVNDLVTLCGLSILSFIVLITVVLKRKNKN